MKKRNNLILLIALIFLLFLPSCASYRAYPLNPIGIESVKDSQDQDINIIAKSFNQEDCKKYLDRNVLRKGYQPIQLYIDNCSDRNYFFSLNRLSLPCAKAYEVAEAVHTSTLARAAGYGAAAILFWPFVLPAVVDGVKSVQANDALDADFLAKAAHDVVIAPYSHVNMLIFVPIGSYQPQFHLTLVDLKNNQPRDFFVHTI